MTTPPGPELGPGQGRQCCRFAALRSGLRQRGAPLARLFIGRLETHPYPGVMASRVWWESRGNGRYPTRMQSGSCRQESK